MPKDEFQLRGGIIPFVDNAKYLCVTFDRKMTCKFHTQTVAAKALFGYVRKDFSLLKSE